MIAASDADSVNNRATVPSARSRRQHGLSLAAKTPLDRGCGGAYARIDIPRECPW
ncbi:hypothetical protein SALB1_2657 [Salinisphaera sp. LB1]|nr:hypothetical protein SALB1_2657 [Salinisphaera sp. LB1]